MSNIVQTQLKAFIERAEQLQREREQLADDERVVLLEVKAAGYDVKVFKDALKVRRQDQAARAEHGELLGLYIEASK